MNRVRNRILFVALAVTLALVVGVTGASAAYAAIPIQAGPPSVTLYGTVVGFGGYEWYVIGHNGSGAVKESGTMTLLAKDRVFGNSIFGANSNYEDSNLHTAMKGVYGGFPLAERGLIKPRSALSDIDGTAVYDHGVWPLSAGTEYGEVSSKKHDILIFKDAGGNPEPWWLRSPGDAIDAYGVNVDGLLDYFYVDD